VLTTLVTADAVDPTWETEDEMEDLTTEASETPTPLPPDVWDSKSASSSELPLHLRVLKMVIQGQVEDERLQQALDIAHEIYELETAGVELDAYRSAS
jgi:hypothetical protein